MNDLEKRIHQARIDALRDMEEAFALLPEEMKLEAIRPGGDVTQETLFLNWRAAVQRLIDNPSVDPRDVVPYTTVYPEGLVVHNPSLCSKDDRPCIFHRPSNHHMVFWTINVRLDRFGALCERTCPHGIGHPDPDSLAYVESLHEPEDRGYEGVHGCDGCCTPPPELIQ